MIGTSPLERARVRELERIADLGVLLRAAQIVHATRSPLGLPPSPELVERSRGPLVREILRAAQCALPRRRGPRGFAPRAQGWGTTTSLERTSWTFLTPRAIRTTRSAMS